MSFRLKTILGVALIEAVLLVLLIVTGVRMVRSSGGDEFEKRAASTAELFAAMTTDAVLSTNIASLETFVAVISGSPDVVYARVFKLDIVLAEAGDTSHSKSGSEYDTGFEGVDDGIFDTVAPIQIAGQTFGRVEIGLSTAQVAALAETAGRQGLFLAAIEMLLVAAFSFVLGTLLTRELAELEEGARQVARGNLGYQLRERGKDELGRVARAFNIMSRRVSEAHADLKSALDDEQRLSEQLAESRTHFQTVLESAVDGIITIDHHGIVATFNAAAEGIFGYDRREVLGQNVKMLMPREIAAKHDEIIANYLETGVGKIIGIGREVVGQRKDGCTFPMDLSVSEMRFGNDRFFNALVRDITEQRAVRTSLRMFSRQMKAVFELSPDGFVVVDQAECVSYVNPAFEEMSGLTALQLVGGSATAFDHELRELCDPERVNVLCSELGDGATDTMHLVRPRPGILRRSCRQTRRTDGGATERVYYFRDVTAEAEVDRMKSEFLSTAAHELRTPLTSIHGFTELLLTRDYDDVKRKDLLQTVFGQSANLTNMVNELLDLARIEARAGKDFMIQRHALSPVIEDVAVAMSATSKGNHRVCLELPAEDLRALFDPEKFSRALTNVLANAYKYSPEGGEIHVSAVTASQGSREQVGVRVRDEGIGMDATQQERLFERFYRGDASGTIPGTGLGMSLVKEIMAIHGGTVEVESAPGQGTTVTLWLPRATAGEGERAS